MKKKTVILADADAEYLKRLSNYFMEKSPQLELYIFTEQMLLMEYLATEKADILVVGEQFANEETAECENVSVKIVLSMSMEPVEGFEVVKKYQKTESLLNDILLKYAEGTGAEEAIKGSSHTRVAAFYSPAGGTGKSVLALGMAAVSAKAGLKTLYLNLEEVDSVKYALGTTPGSLSDLLLALKTKGMNVGIKLASSVGQEALAGFYYVSGVESISEYGETDAADLARLVEAAKGQGEYDVVILDLSSGFSENTTGILEHADVIFVPVIPEEGAISKLIRLLDESNLHDIYNVLFKKMSLIVNRVSARKWDLLKESGLLNRLRCDGEFGEISIFQSKAGILASADALFAVYQPLLNRIMNP